MSRSIRKIPIEKRGGLGKYGKHLAHKKVRKEFDLIGVNTKKLYSGWDIHEITLNGFTSHESKKEEIIHNK